ncbi:MAG: DUF4139 domain-containing protein [Candidatus ainarchaeum sp.]|nr:DUF4139 domain-containing protein [Candidatus ainarchaeum sp.]
MEKQYGLIIVLILILFSILLLFPEQLLVEEKIKLENDFNISEIIYTTQSEKPKEAILKLSSFESEKKEGTELTIYNQNFGLVKDIRNITLEKGINLVEYKAVASKIDSTSVMFNDLKYPTSFIVEQNYEYDLISKTKLLEKYLDKEITLIDMEGDSKKEYTGVLLSYSDGIIIQTVNEIIILDPKKIILPELPENLRTKPTLIWKIYAEYPGERATETTYLTDGINWKAEYVANINNNDDEMDFTGWVSIENKSGTSYPNTALKLVAGDVHRVSTTPKYSYDVSYVNSGAEYSQKQFSEESLFEYHMYTLDRETNIFDNQTKQISLLSSKDVPIKKIFYYDGANQGTKVQVKVEFKNSEDQGLGIPLPKGTVRVYKEDSEGKLQFIGEDSIDHTPKNEDNTLFLGNAFDIVGERKQISSENVSKGLYRTKYEIVLRNQKDNLETIVVHEYVGTSWTIIEKSQNYVEKNSNEIEFYVDVPANGETTITYTVEHRYYW